MRCVFKRWILYILSDPLAFYDIWKIEGKIGVTWTQRAKTDHHHLFYGRKLRLTDTTTFYSILGQINNLQPSRDWTIWNNIPNHLLFSLCKMTKKCFNPLRSILFFFIPEEQVENNVWVISNYCWLGSFIKTKQVSTINLNFKKRTGLHTTPNVLPINKINKTQNDKK